MSDENCKPPKKYSNAACGTCGGVYGFAFLGAAVYFVQQATSFWGGVLGVLKAIILPAMLIYKLMELLKM